MYRKKTIRCFTAIAAILTVLYANRYPPVYAADTTAPAAGWSTIEMMLLSESDEASISEQTDTSLFTADVDMPNIFGLTGINEKYPEPEETVSAASTAKETKETNTETAVVSYNTQKTETKETDWSEPVTAEKTNLSRVKGYDENGVLIPMPKFLSGVPEQFLQTTMGTTLVYDSDIDAPAVYTYSGTGHITKRGGVFYGPSGKETYYNLPMNGVVRIMRQMGYSEEEYPYWVREDGAKMLGDYIMVAAHLGIRPRGTILETSLGTAMVCDTGTFALSNPTQLDLALDW